MAHETDSPSRNEMRSFRLFTPKPAVPLADGSGTEYSAEEIEECRSALQVQIRHRRFLNRCQLGLFISLLLSIFLSGHVAPTIGSVMLGIGIACVAMLKLSPLARIALFPLRCPGCNVNLESQLGEYCPECGHRDSIQRGGLLRGTRCSKCEMPLGFSKHGPTFKIRACTHCGLPLDKMGV